MFHVRCIVVQYRTFGPDRSILSHHSSTSLQEIRSIGTPRQSNCALVRCHPRDKRLRSTRDAICKAPGSLLFLVPHFHPNTSASPIMVNVFQRLVRRATSSSGSTVPDPGIDGNNISSRSHDLHRTTSGNSWKRNRRSVVEEPSPRHLILISDNATFDPHIIQRFQAEGFDVTYLGFVCTDDAEKDRKSLEFAVHEKEDELEAGERYAIVGIYFLPPPLHHQMKKRYTLLTPYNSIQSTSILHPRLSPPRNNQNKPLPPSLRPNRLLPTNLNRATRRPLIISHHRLLHPRLLRHKLHLRPQPFRNLSPHPNPPPRPQPKLPHLLALDQRLSFRRRRILQEASPLPRIHLPGRTGRLRRTQAVEL